MTTLPIIDVAGSHHDIGVAIGESLRDGLHAVAGAHQSGVAATVGWERAIDIARSLIPYAEESLPQCVAELRGMAAGSGVPFETLFSMNALQETRYIAGRDAASPAPDDDDGCTSLAAAQEATANGHVLLAHHHGSLTIDTIFDILSDHSNYPKSVCKHPDPTHNSDTQTVASLVIDLTAGQLHVRPGHPCCTPTTTVAL